MFAALALAVLTAACSDSSEEKTEIILSAAASLGQPLGQIRADFEREHPKLRLTINLGASGALQKQIEQGAPADLFWSAGVAQMDALDKQGLLLDGTRQDAAGNELVLIAPKDGGGGVTLFESLGDAALQKIALGAPETVPAGQYALQTLETLNVWDSVKARAVWAKDVTQVLTYVERGDVEAGIVYRSDAQGSDKVRVVAEAPAGSHKPIVYPLAGIKATRHPDAVRETIRYLTGPHAQEILHQHGFTKAEDR